MYIEMGGITVKPNNAIVTKEWHADVTFKRWQTNVKLSFSEAKALYYILGIILDPKTAGADAGL